MFKSSGKALISFAIFALSLSYFYNTEAFFWRNAGPGLAGYTSPSDPTAFSYGYGYGSSGYGYGYGYGYSYYNSDKSGTGYYGAATQFSSAAISSDTMVQTADFSPLLVNGSVTLTGSGRLTLTIPPNNSTLSVILAAGSTISGTGWDGILQGPVILDVSVSADSRTIQVGSPTKYLTVSPAATVRIPLLNYSSGTTYVSWSSRADTGESSEGATCTIVQDSDSAYYCEVTTTHFSNFWAQTTTTNPPQPVSPPPQPVSPPVTTSITPGGGPNRESEGNVIPIGIIDGVQTYYGSVQIRQKYISVNSESGEKSAQITTEKGTLTLKPNRKSNISLTILPDTRVEAKKSWQGRIDPPVIKKPSELIRPEGITLGDTGQKKERKDIATIVKAGSTESSLNFSNPIRLEIPLKAVEDTVFELYSSPDGKTWSSHATGAVRNNRVTFETDHLSYFAIALSSKKQMKSEEKMEKMTVKKTKFIDMKDHWAGAYIREVAEKGIALGRKEGVVFAPNASITRAELAKMVVNAFAPDTTIDPETKNPFTDIKAGAWHTSYVRIAYQKGWMKGHESGDGKQRVFRPDQPATREEILKTMLRASGQKVDSGYVGFAQSNNLIHRYFAKAEDMQKKVSRAEAARLMVKILGMGNGH